MDIPIFQNIYTMVKKGLASVEIQYSNNRDKDFATANAAAGFKSTPEGYTWHHVEDTKTMQLVLKNIHKLFPHTGGFSVYKNSLLD